MNEVEELVANDKAVTNYVS